MVPAGRGEVVGAAGQRPGDPHDPFDRVSDGLEVHAVAAVLATVVTAAVAAPVTLCQDVIHYRVLRSPLRLAQAAVSPRALRARSVVTGRR